MTRRARLTVDPIACDGRGLCAELLPELVRLDDWGFPVIAGADVPAGLRGEAEAAVRLCPRLALKFAAPVAGPPAIPHAPHHPSPAGLGTGRSDRAGRDVRHQPWRRVVHDDGVPTGRYS